MPGAELPTNARPTESKPPTTQAVVGASAQMPTLESGEPSPEERLPLIPGYQVIRRLGAGGMGEVYEVVDEKVAVRLALKMIRADRVGGDFLARFRREVRTMMLLDHAHVARIYGHGEVDGAPFFTMKFFAGGALSDRPGEWRTDPRQAVELILKVAAAVEYLHQQGQIHRDLKLSNILLDESGEPHLSDFGLVKESGPLPADQPGGEAVTADLGDVAPEAETKPDFGGAPSVPDDPADVLTRPGHVLGTYAYMSPEQTEGRPEVVGPPSDLWGLGVILYELLAGQQPFRAEKAGELLRRIREESPPPPTSFRECHDAVLDGIVLKCLAKNPAQRYASASALAADLRTWLDKDRPAKKRRRVWWLAATAAAVVGLGLLAAWLRFGTKPEVKSPEERLREAQSQLERGDKVDWIGENGEPLYYRVRAGEGVAFARVRPDLDGAFTVDSQSVPVLIELCPDPKCDRYRLEAEVKQINSAQPNARVGLYVFYQNLGPEQNGHQFVHWVFTENLPLMTGVPNQPKPPAGMRLGGIECQVQYYHWDPAGTIAPQKQPVGRRKDFQSPDGNGENEWRPLAVEVGPDGLTLSFRGEVVSKVQRKTLDAAAGRLKLPGGDQAKLEPRTGFGLYVASSSASFRRVVVRPWRAD